MNSLKRLIQLFSVTVITVLLFASCEKEEEATFSLIGKWAMVSGTITNSDGSVDRYPNLGKGQYYQYMEFRTDGTLIKTTMPDKTAYYGTYTYNDATKDLSYKYDGDKYYYLGSINIVSAKEIILTTDYQSLGRVTQNFIKQ